MDESIKRVYIIGPSGSGKTTLGTLLSEKLNLPHVSLDEIAYPNQTESSHEQRLKHISILATQDKWLTEGIYVDWTKKLLDRADLIIWLDLPYLTTLLRVIKRFFVHKLRGDERYGVLNTTKFIWNLRKYYFPKPGFEEGHSDKTTTRIQTRKILLKYKNKIVRIRDTKDLEKFLEMILSSPRRRGSN